MPQLDHLDLQHDTYQVKLLSDIATNTHTQTSQKLNLVGDPQLPWWAGSTRWAPAMMGGGGAGMRLELFNVRFVSRDAPMSQEQTQCGHFVWVQREQHSEGHSGGGGGCNPVIPQCAPTRMVYSAEAPCTPGRHRVGCWPDIPFVHNQLTTLGRWGHKDVAHRAMEHGL
ncbi:hypothetical protein HaLaN_26644 [Haematococcus lacustris]|uniref:Uncharacterized protein n=1 Tax=Haematococcus lacustris TaxID=44745 RepID=A0A6A0A6P3_HAELA|nr:hypothetical protein HaLaN_26644 [Haematococcus lacustris]